MLYLFPCSNDVMFDFMSTILLYNQSYSLMNYNISSAYIGSHSVTVCDDLVFREVNSPCKIPDIKRSTLVSARMKQNVYSRESGTASIDTWNSNLILIKNKFQMLLMAWHQWISCAYVCYINYPIAHLTAQFNDVYIHRGTQAGDDGEDSLLQEMYRLIHMCTIF